MNDELKLDQDLDLKKELVEEKQPDLDSEEELEKEDELPKPDYVKMTLSAGVLPLEMRFSGVYDCYTKKPVAYISYTYMNSVLSGVIPPEKYTYSSDLSNRGVELSKWNIIHAIDAIKAMKEEKRNIKFVSARISPKMLLVDDVYNFMKEIFTKEDFKDNDKLCLEIPKTVLFEDEEKVRIALLNMKLLKVKTMMSGFGEKDTPISMMMNLPFDLVLLAPWLTRRIGDVDEGGKVLALLAYIKSLGIEVIGNGVLLDNQISILLRDEAFGFIPSPRFKSNKSFLKLRMTLKEAIEEEEGEEEWQMSDSP